MTKVKDVKFLEKGIFQKEKGKSLIHRCCGEGMRKIENMDPWHTNFFYVCSKGCGSIELPYLEQLLNYKPEHFLTSATLEYNSK